jgi:hypothetical protein
MTARSECEVVSDGKIKEPWFTADFRVAAPPQLRDALIQRNQLRRQSDKFEFYRRAFDFITDNEIQGDYLEFGCHRARTFRMAINEALFHQLSEMRFYAFDSFCGMPPSSDGGAVLERWSEGNLATSEAEFLSLVRHPALDQSRVKTIKGYYNESLNRSTEKILARENTRAALVCIDCDLYESAKPVFEFLGEFLQEGTVVYLDDFFAGYKGNPFRGIAGAFREFVDSQAIWGFSEYLTVGAFGKSFIAYRR